MNWIKYLLEANLYLALFYVAYYLLLRRETYYQLNRAYLLSSSLLAFIIPLLQLGILKPAPGVTQVRATVDAVTSQLAVQFAEQMTAPAVGTAPAAPINYYVLIYTIIAAVLAVGFGIRIFQLINLSRRGKRTIVNDFKIIEIEEDDRAFSFFNYLFIGKKLTASDTIIRHEIVHIEQRHSMDIIYLELLKIICWFNPFVYLMQYSIKEVHEFIADNYVSVAGQDINAYTDFLISNAYGMPETSLTNNFFNKNLLKTRIMMLHQKRSGNLARLKYLMALPLLAGMLCLSTLGFTKNYTVIDLAPGHSNVIADTIKPASVKPQHKAPPSPPLPPAAKAKTVAPAKAASASRSAAIAPIPAKPKAVPQRAAKAGDPRFPNMGPDSIKKTGKAFFDQLIRNTHYPAVARDKNIQGYVNVTFWVNNDHTISKVQILNSPDESLNNEVTKVLTAATFPPAATANATYSMTFFFALGVNTPVPKTPKIIAPAKPYYTLGGICIYADHSVRHSS